MSLAKQTDGVITLSDYEDLRAPFRDQLHDLLLIHYEISRPSHNSIYLKEWRYVHGEKSAERSCMRFLVNLGESLETSKDDVILTLELSVRNRRN